MCQSKVKYSNAKKKKFQSNRTADSQIKVNNGLSSVQHGVLSALIFVNQFFTGNKKWLGIKPGHAFQTLKLSNSRTVGLCTLKLSDIRAFGHWLSNSRVFHLSDFRTLKLSIFKLSNFWTLELSKNTYSKEKKKEVTGHGAEATKHGLLESKNNNNILQTHISNGRTS